MKTKYGAYDPLYPNGIVSVASKDEIFGLRFLAADQTDHHLIREKEFDFQSLRVKPCQMDQMMDFSWMLNQKKLHLSWHRVTDNTLLGHLEFDEGLEILAELYIPWESRLTYQKWPNFTQQNQRTFAGELIAPYDDYQNNAILFAVDKPPRQALGYNQRLQQYESFEKNGTLTSVSPGHIWGDMGICWYLGVHFTESFSFVLQTGNAATFSETLEQQPYFLDKWFENQPSIRDTSFHSLKGSDLLRDISEAFSAILPFNTIYKSHTERRYIMVDREWSRCEEGWGIQFNWDTFLSSWSASWVDPELAKENMLSGYDAQLPDGKIPLHIRPGKERFAEPPITAGRSQHIVQGITLLHTYLHTKDKSWAKICYEGAKKANLWWFRNRGDGQKYRDALDLGLLGFGYDPEAEMGILGAKCQPYVAKAQYAYFETYDDSPQWTTGAYFKSVQGLTHVTEAEVEDEAKYIEQFHMADIYTLERCCLYAVDCECLSKMASFLGYEEDCLTFQAKHQKMSQLINEHLWCEEDGCYYNRKFDGTFSKKQSPDCFMPLMTGLVPAERKERLLKILQDESKFWGEYMIPSIAKDDPAFEHQRYWRGQIWPPQTLWTYLSLKRADEPQLAWELALKAGKMLANEWHKNGFTPENYNANTGTCSGAFHYNWGVLMGLPLLEELVDFREDKIIFGNPLAFDGMELLNIPIDGKFYDLKIKNNLTMVSCNGKLIDSQQGYVELCRD